MEMQFPELNLDSVVKKEEYMDDAGREVHMLIPAFLEDKKVEFMGIATLQVPHPQSGQLVPYSVNFMFDNDEVSTVQECFEKFDEVFTAEMEERKREEMEKQEAAAKEQAANLVLPNTGPGGIVDPKGRRL